MPARHRTDNLCDRHELGRAQRSEAPSRIWGLWAAVCGLLSAGRRGEGQSLMPEREVADPIGPEAK